ncbi:MAG: pyruvate, phosphate dikinase [Pseudomonadota bacterium]
MRDAAGDVGWIGAGHAPLDPARFGDKAAALSQASGIGLPVPPALVLPFDATEDGVPLAALTELERLSGQRLDDTEKPLLVSVRASAPGGGSGLTPAILNLGLTEAVVPALCRRLGPRAVADLRRRLIQSFGTAVLGIEDEDFEYALHDALKLAGAEDESALTEAELSALASQCIALIADAGWVFPEDAAEQLAQATAALRQSWSAPRAKARRSAKGHDPDAPLAVIVQQMVLGLGPEPSGAGLLQTREETTGAPHLSGRYLAQAQGEEALMGLRTPSLLFRAERERTGMGGAVLEEAVPALAAALADAAARIERGLGDAFTVEFTVADCALHILDLRPARRSARAALRIAVDLAEAGAIAREEALTRIDPRLLEEHLHPSIDPDAARDRIGQGLPASPGAASGPLVFTPEAAEQAAAQGRPAILALIETSPEDIRGMHAALGVVTVRGGMTSHAAVVARGLGRPCVVGAKDLALDREQQSLLARPGRVFRAGDMVTVDGGTGQVLAGRMPTVQPDITGAFAKLMDWADEARRLGVRANADTGEDALVARGFAAAGIGLCRTEHMFFKHGRITPMRRMILAETEVARRAALAELMPMQKHDFAELFEAMAGLPVVIRLLDPPLHEFLPHRDEEAGPVAEALGVSVDAVRARSEELAEFNPMLGKRGCRIGIAYPEIYEMQTRAVFEAALEAGDRTGQPVRPEIMIPLVSAVRELSVLRERIEAVAEAVRAEFGRMVDYTIGVMIETPRACLRAADIAVEAEFLSLGTNDLTQMVYGLSRDDAGRFMPDYVAQDVFAHDPFHSLDVDGVGEMVRMATERARQTTGAISIGLCGEHGADPASVDFCERIRLDYVSCSPFRVPIARLAAAQAAIRAKARG